MTQKLTGRKEIAEFMGWSVSKLRNRQDVMMQSGYLWYDHVGRPPQKHVCAWTTDLQKYTATKGAKKDFV